MGNGAQQIYYYYYYYYYYYFIGSLRCGRFRGDGDVTAQVDWVSGCRSRAKINLLKILMTA